MKKLRILIPVLMATLMIFWLGGELLAAEKIAELSVPKQRVNLDINDNGMDDLFQMDVAIYEDGTVDGQGRFAVRNIKFERGRVSPGQFGTD